MGAVAVAMQQADGDDLDIRLVEPAGQLSHLSDIDGRGDGAVGVQPFPDLEPQLARHQRGEWAGAQVVEVVSGLAAEFENVAEALGCDQRRARAAPLDQRVRGLGGRVDERGERAGLDCLLIEQGANPGHRAVGDIGRDRRHLGGAHHPAFKAHQHKVGEGAADIEAESVAAVLPTFRPVHLVAERSAA